MSGTTEPVRIAEDRTLRVPAGHVVRTDYVDIDVVRMACRDEMSPEAVEKAYRKRLQLGAAQPWPPPVGQWDGDWFVVHDGRHEYLAAMMLGHTHLLVAWLEVPA